MQANSFVKKYRNKENSTLLWLAINKYKKNIYKKMKKKYKKII